MRDRSGGARGRAYGPCSSWAPFSDTLRSMRILYGVVGEGMGHAMRSRVVLEHLFAQGHEVEIMASGRAVDFLDKRFRAKGDVHRIHGLHMILRR